MKTNIISVSELNRHIKDILEANFPDLIIKGEISNLTKHHSGHWFFSLKDKHASLKCILFHSFNKHLNFSVNNGDEVMLTGKVTFYPKSGDAQFNARLIQPFGAGEAEKARLEIKKKLQSKGWLDPTLKKKKPPFIQKVAIISSKNGAAIHDILSILKRRMPFIDCYFFNTTVQGEFAEKNIIRMFHAIESYPESFDAVILARGGGAAEDLWVFNSEKIAECIFHHPYFVISAIGHETDFTISDDIADLRASTPSVAAEMISQDQLFLKKELSLQLTNLSKYHLYQRKIAKNKLVNLMTEIEKLPQITHKKEVSLYQFSEQLFNHFNTIVSLKKNDYYLQAQHLKAYSINLPYEMISQLTHQLYFTLHRRLQTEKSHYKIRLLSLKQMNPTDLIQNAKQTLHRYFKQIDRHRLTHLQTQNATLTHQMQKLNLLNPLNTLERGYSLTYQQSTIIKSIHQVNDGDRLSIQFSDGICHTIISSLTIDTQS